MKCRQKKTNDSRENLEFDDVQSNINTRDSFTV